MATTNDPISDYLTRIRNAIQARHQSLRIPRSKMLLSISDSPKQRFFRYELMAFENLTSILH